MEDIEIQVKKLPAFTVIKNGSILKNILLLRKPSAVDQNQEPDEEILLVGRHPHCQITLEHPSISRYHLRIHSNPSSHIISVVDLSSVHGTWVSGMRIEPGVHVILKEGDTVKIGGSSRVYELHWLPLTQDCKVDQHFVPTVHTIKEGEEETNEEEKHEAYTSDDSSLSYKVSNSPLNTLEPLTSSVPSCSTSDIEVEDSHPLNEIQDPLVVSETTSATQVSDSSEDELNCLRDDFSNESELLNHKIIKEELFSVHNCSKSSCEVEPFTTVASEAVSETESSDCINKSDDKLYWFRDDLSNEFDQISHESMKDDLVSVDVSNAMETHEDDALSQDIARSNETDTDNDSEPENQQNTDSGSDSVVLFDGGSDVVREFEQREMMDESASMVPYDGVEFESVDHEIMKKGSGFVHLPDVTDMDQEEALTPDISKAKEIHMNLQSVQNGSASTKLFDSLDENEMELYTPDKENKNPNAFSGKSLSKKAVNSTVKGEKDIFGLSQKLISTDEGVNGEHEVDPFLNCEILASSEKENTSRQMIMEGSSNSINYPQTVQKAVNSSQNLAKKRWTMVVDTDSFLDQKSLKHLKLLEGIKGTRLFVPKFAVNELMDLNSQDSFFKRSTEKASLALKWIDKCMMNTQWWIHMEAETVHSSTAVAQVLEIALSLREEMTDQKIIILSNNLMLKTNAMAQGIMCEAAEEFHESLVNPFSERFMWVGSSARGLTWSCADDIVRQKYHRFGVIGSHELKGLKLLAHVTTS